MVQYFVADRETKQLRLADRFIEGCWVNLVNSTFQELEAVAQQCHLQLNLLEDSIDPHELPRLERENGGLYLFMRLPLERPHDVTTRPLTVITTPAATVTVSVQSTPILDRFVHQQLEVDLQHPLCFFAALAQEVIRSFYLHTKAIAKKVSRQRVNLRNLRNRDIVNLVENDEMLSDFHTALHGNIDVFDRLLSGKAAALGEQERDQLQDLVVDARQVQGFCQESINTITNIRDSYNAILSNNLNKTLKFLTSITIILTIPLLIASIYGMNIRLPYADDPNAFTFVMGLSVISGLVTFVIFVWRKWI